MGVLSNRENKTYATVTNGKFAIRLKGTEREGEPGVNTRKLENGPNKGDKICETLLDHAEGFIKKASVTSGEYGDRLEIHMVDSLLEGAEVTVLQVGAESRYGGTLMKRWSQIDFSKEVKLTPWRKESENKYGIAVSQGGPNYKSPYTQDNPGDLPEATQNKKGKWNFDDQNEFLVKKFLSHQPDPSSLPVHEPVNADVEPDNEEDDVPF